MKDCLIVDLHTHTYYSDGELGPAELAQRAKVRGYSVLGIADHSDFSNYQRNLDELLAARENLTSRELKVLIGVELTHVPPRQLETLIFKCRERGAQYIIVHGETLVEPVEPGTNEAAIKAGADILAHPGLIEDQWVELAAVNKVFLELTARRGGCLTNGYVAQKALQYGAPLIINTDAHAPSDLFSDLQQYRNIALGAGIKPQELSKICAQIQDFVKKY